MRTNINTDLALLIIPLLIPQKWDMTLTAVINPVVPLNLLSPLQRVICPQSRQSAKYRIVTHNFTNDDITNGKSPSYHGQNSKSKYIVSIFCIHPMNFLTGLLEFTVFTKISEILSIMLTVVYHNLPI